jgi:isopentenyl-diphosphate delta-isomerase type 1
MGQLWSARDLKPESASKEILEVVDENDRVIGRERRDVIHRKGLMHRSAQVLVFNSRGELFLQKRSHVKDEFPGLWDSSAAGHVNPGESYIECARREVAEELGISRPGELAEICRFPASRDTGFEHCVVHRCTWDGPLTLQAGEVEDGRWLKPEEMDALVADPDEPLTPAIRQIWLAVRGTL